MLSDVIKRYQNRSIETAQVMEELVQMAKKFREAAARGEQLGLTEDEVRFYDALANNESAVRELSDETLKKIAHELTENLRKNLSVDWSAARKRARQAAFDGQAHSAQVQIPAGSARCGGRAGACSKRRRWARRGFSGANRCRATSTSHHAFAMPTGQRPSVQKQTR